MQDDPGQLHGESIKIQTLKDLLQDKGGNAGVNLGFLEWIPRVEQLKITLPPIYCESLAAEFPDHFQIIQSATGKTQISAPVLTMEVIDSHNILISPTDCSRIGGYLELKNYTACGLIHKVTKQKKKKLFTFFFVYLLVLFPLNNFTQTSLKRFSNN